MTEERKYKVYLHINKINNKVYVGITHYKNPNYRWVNGKGYKNNVVFTRAIKKYGWNNFDHIILYDNLTKEIACKQEQFLIQLFREEKRCYNIMNGGEGTTSMSQEVREKLSQYRGPRASQFGRKFTEEELAQKSVNMKKYWSQFSAEERKKMLLKRLKGKRGKVTQVSEENRRSISERFSKPVYCYTLFGELLMQFPSMVKAADFLGIDDGHIGACCIGKRNSAGGYLWRFEKSNMIKSPYKIFKIQNDSINYISRFTSINTASKVTGLSYQFIKNRLKGIPEKSKVKSNYVIKYIEDGFYNISQVDASI